MSSGIRRDLKERLIEAHEHGMCLAPTDEYERHRLRRAARHGLVLSPVPQVYTLPELWNDLKPIQKELCKIRSLSVVHPTWVFAGVSAALVYGLQVSYHLVGEVQTAVTRRAHTRSIPGIRRIQTSGDTFRSVNGIRVTSLKRTVFDCLRMHTFGYGLAIADSALRHYHMSRDELVDDMARMHKCHEGWQQARDTARWADGLSENGGESIARAVMIEQGFMLPRLQVEMPNPVDALQTYRVDFYWDLPQGEVAGELDGRDKYTSAEMTGGRDIADVLADERLRESRLSGSGAKIMRFSYGDVLNRSRFRHLLSSYGVPSGYPIPDVAHHAV